MIYNHLKENTNVEKNENDDRYIMFKGSKNEYSIFYLADKKDGIIINSQYEIYDNGKVAQPLTKIRNKNDSLELIKLYFD